MIEKILSIIWVGPHRMPEELIKTWSDKHTNSWLFVLWKDHLANWENQDQINHRYARREYNGVADLMRYEILLKTGGFVVDADSECLKALDEGPEDFLSNETAVACFENEAVRPGMVSCGFLGAPKGHPFFRACVDEARIQDGSIQAWRTVGPMLMSKVSLRLPDQIKVYPAKMFNDPHYSGAAAPGDHPIYARQKWGSTRGYNSLRRLPCSCPECQQTALRPSWG
jgi:mannosyltransferase OCH1-like enzyme